ncbi:hypothetical protein GCM10025868_05330 [Angustibacter aerolatus]|uniref:TRAM domain-containing protein n=1 Tax=Angustibacter aerolatus TaxID=1162965 RepID=A0ABQ6JAT5_9ACTN|nr:hypothetical protein GCM10025868_05330 [Angustibacter aerolatus]
MLAVEGDAGAVRDARRNLHDAPHVAITPGRVDRVLATLLEAGTTADLVVLDPPRTGAGRTVVDQVVALAPRAVSYVACDPAALARDVRTFADAGYEPGRPARLRLLPDDAPRRVRRPARAARVTGRYLDIKIHWRAVPATVPDDEEDSGDPGQPSGRRASSRSVTGGTRSSGSPGSRARPTCRSA